MLFALLIITTLLCVIFMGHIFDIVFAIVMIVFFVYGAIQKKEYQQQIAGRGILATQTLFNEIATLIVVLIVLVASHVYSYFVQNVPFTFSLIQVILWVILAVLFALNLFRYGFAINMNENVGKYLHSGWAALHDENKVQVDVDVKVKAAPAYKPMPEVFNIAENIYSYSDAQAVCKAMDGRLATYSEIESAYNNGSDFCNYGWSDDQMILFPTQKATWDVLQTTKHKNSCGRPGVNGGFMENKKALFGANCFGIKPNQKKIDEISDVIPEAATSAVKKEEEDGRIAYYKGMGDNIQVNSFNTERWSEY